MNLEYKFYLDQVKPLLDQARENGDIAAAHQAFDFALRLEQIGLEPEHMDTRKAERAQKFMAQAEAIADGISGHAGTLDELGPHDLHIPAPGDWLLG